MNILKSLSMYLGLSNPQQVLLEAWFNDHVKELQKINIMPEQTMKAFPSNADVLAYDRTMTNHAFNRIAGMIEEQGLFTLEKNHVDELRAIRTTIKVLVIK